MHRRALLQTIVAGAVASAGAGAAGGATAQSSCDVTVHEAAAELHEACDLGTQFEASLSVTHDGCEGPFTFEVRNGEYVYLRSEQPLDGPHSHEVTLYRTGDTPDFDESVELVLLGPDGAELASETVPVVGYWEKPPALTLTDARVSPGRLEPGETLVADVTLANDGGDADLIVDLVANGEVVESQAIEVGARGCRGTVESVDRLRYAFSRPGAYALLVVVKRAETGAIVDLRPLGTVLVGDVAAEAVASGVAVSGGLTAAGALAARRAAGERRDGS